MPNYDAVGNPRCVVCNKPNDPSAPLSPYCVKHRRKARTTSEASSRRRGKDAQDLMAVLTNPTQHQLIEDCYVGPLGIGLLPAKADELRAEYGRLLAAIEQARRNTAGFVAKADASPETRYAISQLRAVIAAAQDLNEVLAPVLYGFKPTTNS